MGGEEPPGSGVGKAGTKAGVFVISGPGGVGKSTLARRLAANDATLWLSTSWTTRPRREGEDPGAYVFVDRERFMERVASGGFMEWAEFNGNLYGTPVPELPPGTDLLLEIEVQGAKQVLSKDPGAVVILVTAPSWEAVAERMRGRGDPEEQIARRIEIGRREEAEAREIADRVVVNDDLDRTVAELAAIIEECRRAGCSPAPSRGH